MSPLRLLVALALLIAVALPPAHAATPTKFELFSLDCNGQFHIMNSLPIGMSFGHRGLNTIVDHVWAKLKDRINCKCPQSGATNMPPEEFARKFLINGIYNMMLGDNSVSSSGPFPNVEELCPTANDLTKLHELKNAFKFEFPDTCRYGYSDYTANGCKVKIASTSGKMRADLIFATKTCPNSNFPYISLAVDGGGFNNFFKPCTTSDTCSGGTTCLDLTQIKPFGEDIFDVETRTSSPSLMDLNDVFYDILDAMGLYEDGDYDKQTCYTSASLFSELRTFLLPWMFKSDDPAGPVSYKFCSSSDVFVPRGGSFDPESFMLSMWGLSVTTRNRLLGFGGEYTHIQFLNMVQGWDGKFSDGTDIFDSSRMYGSAFGAPLRPPDIESNSVPFMGMFCDGSMYFQIGQAFGQPNPIGGMGRMVAPIPLFDFLTKMVWNQQLCRLPSITKDAFFKLIQFWSPYMMMDVWTAVEGTFRSFDARKTHALQLLGDAKRTPYTDLLPNLEWDDEYCDYHDEIACHNGTLPWERRYEEMKINMVSTCSAAEYASTKLCKFKYTGLGTLLGMPFNSLDLVAGITECPAASPGGLTHPQMHLKIEGSAVNAFNPLKTCTSDSDCASNFECFNIPEVADAEDLLNWFVWDSFDGPQSGCDKWRVPDGGSKSQLAADMVAYLTGSDPGNTPASFKFCTPRIDFGGVASRAENMVSTSETQDVVISASDNKRGTRYVITLNGLVPYTGEFVFPLPPTVQLDIQVGVKIEVTGVSIITLPSFGGADPVKLTLNTGDAKVDVEVSSDGEVQMTFESGISIKIPATSMAAEQSIQIMPQTQAETVAASPPAVGQVAASEALVFGAEPPLETTIDMTITGSKQRRQWWRSVSGLSHAIRRLFSRRSATTTTTTTTTTTAATPKTYRLHWLNKRDNTWVPNCEPHLANTTAATVAANITSVVQTDARYNPKTPDGGYCHSDLASTCTNSSGGVILAFEESEASLAECAEEESNKIKIGVLVGIAVAAAVGGCCVIVGVSFALWKMCSKRTAPTGTHEGSVPVPPETGWGKHDPQGPPPPYRPPEYNPAAQDPRQVFAEGVGPADIADLEQGPTAPEQNRK